MIRRSPIGQVRFPDAGEKVINGWSGTPAYVGAADCSRRCGAAGWTRRAVSQQLQPSGSGQVGPPPLALVEQKLNQVASDLRDVAKVLVMSKPALMPVLQKMIQAGAMLMQEINAAKQQGQPQQPSGPPEPPGGEGGQAEDSPTMDQ